MLIAIEGMTTRYCTNTFSGSGSSDKAWLRNVTIDGGEVDVVRFETTNFQLTFEVLDIDGSLQSRAANGNLTGRKVTAKIGFQEISESQFLQLPITYIEDWTLLQDTITWRIRSRFRLSNELSRKIFRYRGVTELLSAITDTQTTFNVPLNESDRFYAANSAPWGNQTKTYLRVDNEIMEYTNKSVGASYDTFTVTRGQLGTTAVDHDAGAKVEEVYYIYDNPFDFLVQVLTNTKYDAPWSSSTALPSWFGLSLDKDDEVDVSQIDSERRKWIVGTNTWEYGFFIDREWDAGEFIRMLLSLLPGYFIYTENAKLGVKVWDFRYKQEGYDLTRWTDGAYDSAATEDSLHLVTHLDLSKGFDPGKGDWSDQAEHSVSAVTSRYGRKQTIHIRPPIYPDIGSDEWDGFRKRYLRNATYGLMRVDTKQWLERWHHQLGDVVSFTHPKMVAMTGGRGQWNDRALTLLKCFARISAEEAHCEFSGLDYDHFQTVDPANGLSLEFFREMDIDDTTMVVDSPGSDTTDANDAYCDMGSMFDGDEAHVTIEATLPGGSSSWYYAEFEIRAGDPTIPSYDKITRRIYFYGSWTGTIRREFVITRPSGSTKNWSRVKVDFIANGDGGINVLSNVKLIQVKVLRDDYTITES